MKNSNTVVGKKKEHPLKQHMQSVSKHIMNRHWTGLCIQIDRVDSYLRTDPYQKQERIMENKNKNPIVEDMNELRNVDVEMSYDQLQIYSDYVSAESNADSDLKDGELRKILTSLLYFRGRGHSESSRRPTQLQE